jgi:hypothetical protein
MYLCMRLLSSSKAKYIVSTLKEKNKAIKNTQTRDKTTQHIKYLKINLFLCLIN